MTRSPVPPAVRTAAAPSAAAQDDVAAIDNKRWLPARPNEPRWMDAIADSLHHAVHGALQVEFDSFPIRKDLAARARARART